MNKLTLPSAILLLLAMFFLTTSATFHEVDSSEPTLELGEYFKPDFRISKIATPGGLCQGSKNKIRVTVTNSGRGYKQPIPVTLFVSQQGNSQSFVGYLQKGFSGRSNYGQPVWFHDIEIKEQQPVQIRAVVNWDKEIEETNIQNNDKRITARVTRACDAPRVRAAANLTVGAYNGPATSPSPVSGVNVRVFQGHCPTAYPTGCQGQIAGANANTGANGKVTLNNIPRGRVTVKLYQGQSYLHSQVYQMPTYNASLNIVMD